MGHSVDQLTNLARDTGALFTGGATGEQAVSGGDVGQGAKLDIAGLGAGAGLAGSGLAAGGGSAAAGGGSPFDVLTSEDLASGAGQASTAAKAGVDIGSPLLGTGLWSPSSTFSLPTGVPAGGVQSGGGTLGTGTGGAVTTTPPATPPAAAPATPAGGGATAPTAVTGQQGAAQGGDVVSGILDSMRKNAGLLQLGLAGTGLAMASKKPAIPNADQLNALAQTGSQAAKDLIGSYRSGQLSAAQQASLDQLTQGTKNQINQYFASIGQSDSTAHMQALAQVDQQALGMKQQMLDNMLQQGLQAIGVAGGPLQTIANYQMQQDKNLTEAFGSFASAVGQAFGKQAGTTTQPPQPQTPGNITGTTPSSGAGQTAPPQ